MDLFILAKILFLYIPHRRILCFTSTISLTSTQNIYDFQPSSPPFSSNFTIFLPLQFGFITKCIFATGQLKTYILVKTFKEWKGCSLCNVQYYVFYYTSHL